MNGSSLWIIQRALTAVTLSKSMFKHLLKRTSLSLAESYEWHTGTYHKKKGKNQIKNKTKKNRKVLCLGCDLQAFKLQHGCVQTTATFSIYTHMKLCKNFLCTKLAASWPHITLSKEFDPQFRFPFWIFYRSLPSTCQMLDMLNLKCFSFYMYHLCIRARKMFRTFCMPRLKFCTMNKDCTCGRDTWLAVSPFHATLAVQVCLPWKSESVMLQDSPLKFRMIIFEASQ